VTVSAGLRAVGRSDPRGGRACLRPRAGAEDVTQQTFPLGIARPGSQTFERAAGLDLGESPLVDASVEPPDGDPAHSGDSVAHGEPDTWMTRSPSVFA
jgi:hypothetical protein